MLIIISQQQIITHFYTQTIQKDICFLPITNFALVSQTKIAKLGQFFSLTSFAMKKIVKKTTKKGQFAMLSSNFLQKL